ncbi:putative piggyBac transposable element-derived protein 4-like [Apostichopus japonicus]|uniref:Putative piggyBac transposable element-derived protein 4-like n=1 Tax=Stichopus japonicus TaxID=307972 RepID=A0A2G8KYD4_STIJA|nr:putative piggyBac transposable element-derived protein 4-like [Apostichopus japonicus]
MSIQPFEDFDIAESEEDSEDDISDVELANLPGESLVDDPSARPPLLLRDPDMRPATPAPVLDATSRADFKQRCEARKAALGGYNKKLSPQEAHEKWTLLVEDNEDRSKLLRGMALGRLHRRCVLKNLVDQSNLYASQEGVKTVDGGGKYIPVTRESVMAYIGLTIAMGLTNKSKIDAYWSTNQILETPWFRQVMPRSLYQQHQRYLHVSDNTMGEKTAEGRFSSVTRSVRYLIP